MATVRQQEVDESSESDEDAADPKKVDQPNLLPRVMVFGCLGMLLFGYDTGIVSGAIVMVAEEMDLDTNQKQEVVAATLLFAAMSTVIGIPLNSQFGRKPVVMGAALLYAAGSLIIGFAGGYRALLLGRSLLGVAIGFASGTVPMYSAEMAPSSMRGLMVTLNDLNIVVGQLLASLTNVYFAGQEAGWRWSMGLAAAPAVVLFVGFIFLPESPRWLALAGKKEKAESVLRKMEGKEEARARLQDILETINQEYVHGDLRQGNMLTRACKKLHVLWCNREVQRATILGISLMAMNQFSGINTVMYYSATILMKAGFSKGMSLWLAALCCAAQLAGVVISVFSMDRAGRRKTALRSTAGVVVTLLVMAVSFQNHGALWNDVKVAGLMFYLVSFGAGLSGVPWVINSEIYPLRVRSSGVGQATTFCWIFNWMVGRFFLTVCDAVGASGAFGIFAIVSVLGGLWLYIMLPETMGVPLECIETLFQDPYPKSSHKGADSTSPTGSETDSQSETEPESNNA